IVRATIKATGIGGKVEVLCQVDQGPTWSPPAIELKQGQSEVVSFSFLAAGYTDQGARVDGLPLGPHQATFRLAASDALALDNVRHATFEVRGGRSVLTITDKADAAFLWNTALNLQSLGGFRNEVMLTSKAVELDPRKMLDSYRAVCLLGVTDPPEQLWEKL